MERLDGLARLCSSGYIGLIGHNDESKSRATKSANRIMDTRKDFKFRRPRRGVWPPAKHQSPVDDPIPIQENSPSGHRVTDSHFVWFTFRTGCETSKCQITA